MLEPLLSIILPTHNSQGFLSTTIASIIAQTVSNWELIIIDDASTDGTLEKAHEFAQSDSRIHIVAQKTNRGAAYSRNVGLERAEGRMIAFIDSDDLWFPDKIEKQLYLMERYRADISYTSYIRSNEHDNRRTVVKVPARVTYHSMLRRNKIACSTAVVRRSTCGTVRQPPITRRCDHGYWLALLRDGGRTAIGLNEPLAVYRVHRQSLSANKIIAARYSWRLLRDVEHFGVVRSAWYFSGYVLAGILSRTVWHLSSQIVDQGDATSSPSL